MLNKLFKGNEDKVREKIEVHVQSGLKLLSEKFYNKAMIEFNKALELSREDALPRLKSEMESAASSGALESAMSIGLNLLKDNPSDYELANKLGNFARELRNFNQADGLYKQALKINKNFEKAFYNLAASTARVDKYDESAQNSLSVFNDIKDYVLPDYQGDPKLIDNLTEALIERKEEEVAQKIQVMSLERDQKDAEGDVVVVKELDMEIKALKSEPIEVKPEGIIKEMQKKITEDPGNEKAHRYNLAIYALSKKKPEIAENALSELSSKDFESVKLLEAIIMDQRGKTDQAANHLIKLLGENEFNRFYNVNIGMMYKRAGKKFLAAKYLIKTASLLEKSNGLYSMKALIRLADENYQADNLKKALSFYKIAASEIQDADLYDKIGTILMRQKKYDEATEAFRKLKEIDPNSSIADTKLKELHDYYSNKGDSLLNERKFKGAGDYYHKALRVLRLPETLKKAAGVYKELKNPEMEKELLEEYNKIIEGQKEEEMEKERQKLIIVAKQYMAKKNYFKAVQTYEAVFRMKMDKNIFLQLAALYKGLKKHEDLHGLIQRWEKMVEHQEKMIRYEKDKERAQQSGKEKA